MLAAAKRPTLYVGVGLRCHGLTELVVRLAEHLRLPLATDVLGKAAIPESHPQFAGVYMGVLGDPAVREMLDGSDCVIVIGVVRTDHWNRLLDRAHQPEVTDLDRSRRRARALSPLRRAGDSPGCRSAGG